MTRRFAFAACVLAVASLLAGCVEITNPQFDARYRIAVRPVGKPLVAVFAVREEEQAWSAFAPRTAPVRVVLVDTSERAAVATIPLEDVVAVSDLAVSYGRRKLLASLATGFAEVDLDSRIVTPAPAPALARGGPVAAQYDMRGVPVMWQVTDDGRPWLVSRGVAGAEPETAAAVLALTARPKVAAPTAHRIVLAQSDQESDAADFYTVLSSGSVTRWRADFKRRAVTRRSEPELWAEALDPAKTRHVERPIARFGPPFLGPGGLPSFVVDGGGTEPRTVSALPTSPLVFEPGGERYLEVRHREGSGSWTVVEGSLVTTRTSTVFSELVPASGLVSFEPLAWVGGRFAYAETRTGGSTESRTTELHLYDPVARADAVVSSLESAPGAVLTVDYLGSFERPD